MNSNNQAFPIFLFVDLNSYFATAEQQARPHLRGVPIGVCEHLGGIILAPSREAKLKGVKTGMPTWEAIKICPEIIFLPVDADKIRDLTSKFYKIAEYFSDFVEHISVDEVSINVTDCISKKLSNYEKYEEAINIAIEIKKQLQLKMGDWITASIGIAKNRLLAKIGTELQKPNGLVLIDEKQQNFNGVLCIKESNLYDLLELSDIPGIGDATVRSLQAKGILTLKELSEISKNTLHAWYGISGLWLYDLAHFEDAWKNVDFDKRETKSVGHQFALGKKNALYSLSEVEGLVSKLTEKICRRLRNSNLTTNTIYLYIGLVNGGGMGGSYKIGDFVDDTSSVMAVLDKVLRKISRNDYLNGVSSISVVASSLLPKTNQGVLFSRLTVKDKITKALDNINNRYGDFALMYGQTLKAGDRASDTVGFGRVKERVDW